MFLQISVLFNRYHSEKFPTSQLTNQPQEKQLPSTVCIEYFPVNTNEHLKDEWR